MKLYLPLRMNLAWPKCDYCGQKHGRKTWQVDGKKGKVVDINLRYVTLTDEGQHILVPNSLLVSKSLVVQKREL